MKQQYVLIYTYGNGDDERSDQEWFDSEQQLHKRATALLNGGGITILLSARISDKYEYEPKEVVTKWQLID